MIFPMPLSKDSNFDSLTALPLVIDKHESQDFNKTLLLEIFIVARIVVKMNQLIDLNFYAQSRAQCNFENFSK